MFICLSNLQALQRPLLSFCNLFFQMVLKVNSGQGRVLEFGSDTFLNLAGIKMTANLRTVQDTITNPFDFPPGVHYIAMTYKYPDVFNTFIDGVKFPETPSKFRYYNVTICSKFLNVFNSFIVWVDFSKTPTISIFHVLLLFICILIYSVLSLTRLSSQRYLVLFLHIHVLILVYRSHSSWRSKEEVVYTLCMSTCMHKNLFAFLFI